MIVIAKTGSSCLFLRLFETCSNNEVWHSVFTTISIIPPPVFVLAQGKELNLERHPVRMKYEVEQLQHINSWGTEEYLWAPWFCCIPY